MRVMLLASGDLWAGAEVMIYQLACGLSKIPRLELCVVLLNNNRLAEKLIAFGIAVKIYDESNQSFLSILGDVRKFVAKFSPNIIHSHRYKENILAWLSCLGISKAKLVVTQHGMPEKRRKKQSIKNRLRTVCFFRQLSWCFNRTIVVSEEMRQALKGKYGFSNGNITVIHNGIEVPKDVGKQEKQPLVIGSAGRLYPVKDYSLLVDIAAQVVMQNDTINFVLAGDGPQRLRLEQKVKNYGIEDRFMFLGHQEDMVTFYRGLDVYINTSVHEGIPMSILEAMSYELPVVVPDVGGFPEIVHNNRHGFLIQERNLRLYVDSLLYLNLNKNLRLKIAKSARKRVVECFSRETMTQKYFNLYEEVLKEV